MIEAKGRIKQTFDAVAAKFGMSVDVFIAGFYEMPVGGSYAVYDPRTDAIYILDGLAGQLSKDELTAIAMHEVYHAFSARWKEPLSFVHRNSGFLHKAWRKRVWKNGRHQLMVADEAEAKHERTAENKSMEITSLASWINAIAKGNMISLVSHINIRYKSKLGGKRVVARGGKRSQPILIRAKHDSSRHLRAERS